MESRAHASIVMMSKWAGILREPQHACWGLLKGFMIEVDPIIQPSTYLIERGYV